MSGIAGLTTATALGAGDLFPLQSAADADERKTTLQSMRLWMQDNWTRPNTQFVRTVNTPALTGFVVTVDVPNTGLILAGSSTLAAGTVNVTAMRTDGDMFRMVSERIVTAFTWTGGGALVVGAPTTLAVGSFFTMQYDAGQNTWYRVA